MKICLATLADLETILKLMPLYYAHDHLIFDPAKARATLQEFLSSPQFGRLWLLMDEKTDAVIGYLTLAFCYSFECGGREAFIDEFYILENYRSCGLGSHAMEFTKQEAKKLGVRMIRLEVTKDNPRVVGLYRKHGFEDLGRSLLACWIDPAAHSL